LFLRFAPIQMFNDSDLFSVLIIKNIFRNLLCLSKILVFLFLIINIHWDLSISNDFWLYSSYQHCFTCCCEILINENISRIMINISLKIISTDIHFAYFALSLVQNSHSIKKLYSIFKRQSRIDFSFISIIQYDCTFIYWSKYSLYVSNFLYMFISIQSEIVKISSWLFFKSLHYTLLHQWCTEF
jgi:hypothetical protein